MYYNHIINICGLITKNEFNISRIFITYLLCNMICTDWEQIVLYLHKNEQNVEALGIQG
jgi:hypothetical protein